MRYKQIKPIQEMQLDEINMSPTSLRQLASQIDARAGMEFEMIVPNAEGGDDGDQEPDYDYDERVRDIEDCITFFNDGDYNSTRILRSVREEMDQAYLEWKFEKIDEEWANNGFEFFTEYLDREEPFDEEDYLEQAVDMALTKNPDLQSGTDEYDDAVREALDEINANYYTEQWEEQGRNYDNALDEFRDEQSDNFSENDWLDEQGIRYASDVESAYPDLTWPYWTNSGGDGRDVDEVADSFKSAVGRPIIASRSYHSAERKPGHYVVEPDGSLDGDNPGDSGLEFVSPPLPVSELFDDLRKVKDWAESEGCYTNRSTGLHMNISVPSLEGNVEEKLDYVKLALLMGDNYVLEQFGRSGNTYCKSALDKVTRLAKDNPTSTKDVLDKMKGHLDQLASKAIHGTRTDKYTSINTKKGYVEFRSPGGDWLGTDTEKLENTMLRFVVALDAACDPDKYREEYLKKLYKLLNPIVDTDPAKKDTIKYFADYVAGKTPKAALRSFIKQAQLERKLARGPKEGEKYWWSVERPGYFASVEVVATSKEEAIEKGKVEYPDWRNAQNMTATPLRPYQEPTRKSTGPTLNDRPSNPDGNYVILNMADETVPVYRFMAANDEDALSVQQQWSRANPGPSWRYKADPNQRLGQPVAQAQQTQTGNWGIWIQGADRFARAPGQSDNSVLRRFPGRDSALQWIEQARRENPNMRTDIEVREIEPAPVRANIGAPQAVGSRNRLSQTDIENRLGWGGQEADANYEVVDRSNMQPVFKFIANTETEAQRKYTQVLDVFGFPHDTEDYGFREIVVPGSTIDLQRQRAAQTTQQTFTGEWDVLMGGELVFRVRGETQAIANDAARTWILGRSREFLHDHQGEEVEVVPRYR